MSEARIIIHTYRPTSGEEQLKYMWQGPIDGEILVANEYIGEDVFKKVPFKLMWIRSSPDGRTAVFIRVDWRARAVRLFRQTMRKISGVIVLASRFFRIIFPEWFAQHCPVLIPTRRPQPPKSNCQMCEKPYAKIIAIDTGEGFELDWECDSGCGHPVIIDNWYPFWFGAWAKSTDLEKIGIEVV